MITVALLFLFTISITSAVLWPVIQGVRRPWLLDVPSGDEEALRQEQVSALDALRDLALDFRLGNLTPEDYRALAAPLQQRARRTLELQATHAAPHSSAASAASAGDLDAQLEAEILSLRHATEPGKGRTVVIDPDGESSRVRFCPSCGASVASTFRFCAGCGHELPTLTGPIPAAPPNGDQLSQNAANGKSSIQHTPPAPAATPAPSVEIGQPSRSFAPSIQTEQSSRSSPRRWLWWVAALVGIAWVVGIVGFYLNSRASQENQTPLASLPNVAVQSLTVADGNLFVGATDGLRISENGQVWNTPSFGEAVQTLVALGGAEMLLLTADTHQIWRSADGGATWQQQDLPPGINLLAMAGLPSGGKLLIGADERTLYASEDGGQNWWSPGGTLPGQVRALALGQGEIFTGTSRGVFRSEDGGASWIGMNGTANGAIASTDVRALAYDDANGIVFAGTPFGLSFMNMDSFGGWGQRSLDVSVAALALDPGNPAVLWVGTEDGRIFRSPDRGVSWR